MTMCLRQMEKKDLQSFRQADPEMCRRGQTEKERIWGRHTVPERKIMGKIYAGTSKEISERESRNLQRSRKIGAEGMVLLENNGVLPFGKDIKKLALFGTGARNTIKGGTGSGDVNCRESISVERGLEESGFEIVTKNWIDRYSAILAEAKKEYSAYVAKKSKETGMHPVAILFTEPFKEPEVSEILPEDLQPADAAIFVVSRNSGEGKDRRPVSGDYELSREECQAMEKLAQHYGNLVVLLNVGGVMDTKFFRETKGIGAVLLMSQAGSATGLALADVIAGKTPACGRLTTTWAEKYTDYPSAGEFSFENNDLEDEQYLEGIYVGYRYFDTFGVKPAYPFGYGLSYTDFAVECTGVQANGTGIQAAVRVTNIGKTYSGREVVQLYVSAPDGSLEKPYQELKAFAKTKLLAPGECEEVILSFAAEDLASYDQDSAAWVLEAGDYVVRIGKNCADTKTAAVLTLDKEVITRQLTNRMVPKETVQELSRRAKEDAAAGCRENGKNVGQKIPTEEEKAAELPRISLNAADFICKTITYRDEAPAVLENKREEFLTLEDVIAGKATLEELAAQLTPEQLTELCVGTARGAVKGGDSIIGAASTLCPGAAGDTTSALLEDRKVPNMTLADGPAGLRLMQWFAADPEGKVIPGVGFEAISDLEGVISQQKKPIPENAGIYYQYCTAIPIATLLAQTWDMEALREAGDIVGEEMEEYGVALWLAPGMNIHRNPLCGRNFEYFSEDPLIAGCCAAADTLGVQAHKGCGTTIKHFALNNQEDNRMHVNNHVSERAIREIYLKGFEIAVKTAQPISIMSSYNLVNGEHTANSRDLLTSIARQEWGFEGVVMTDWGTTGGMDSTPECQAKYGHSNPARCIQAGNDLIMPGNNNDVKAILKSLGAKEGEVPCPITLGELQACAVRVMAAAIRCKR